MIAQRNIFSPQVDIITTADDKPERVSKALQALGSNAGRIITERGKAPAPQVEKQVRQTKLF